VRNVPALVIGFNLNLVGAAIAHGNTSAGDDAFSGGWALGFILAGLIVSIGAAVVTPRSGAYRKTQDMDSGERAGV
jgi:hypothetical protein